MDNTKLKIVAVIQARLGSTRLPGKALKKILDKTLIEWIAYRLSFCREVDQIVLSTADNEENSPLVDLAKSIGLKYFCGSEDDLVSRIYNTAKRFSADAIVRVTGDCPLVDPRIVDSLVIKFRQQSSLEYITNILPPTFPDGLDVEVISFKALKRLDREVKDKLRREWITTTIMENPGNFKTLNIKNKKDLSGLRLTVDYPKDFELVKRIFFKLHRPEKIFVLADILKLLNQEPMLSKINEKHVDKHIFNNIRSGEFHKLKSVIN